jgi:copper chaperone
MRDAKEVLVQFHIQNMACGGCARSVTKAIQSVDPGANVAVDLETRKVDITSERRAAEFERVLAQAGYPASP